MNVDALLATHFVPNAIVVGTTLVAVGLAVLLHYQGLNALNSRLVRPVGRRGHRTVVMVVFALIGLHVGEICLFGVAYWVLIVFGGIGGIHGAAGGVDLLEGIYLSATTYSTVGFGDVAPTGPIRFLAATESLIGLMLITWSASFTFLEMSRRWTDEPGRGARND